MVEFVGIIFGLGFFGFLIQRNVLGALLSLQVMTTAMILGLVVFTGNRQDGAMIPVAIGRARDAGLILMIVFQIQAVAGLAFITRLHYLRLKSELSDLTKLRN